MKRLIVNADGFGFTRGINRGIRDACEAGFIRSISVDANFPAVDELPDFLARFPGLSVGVHFNLTVGRPLLAPGQVPSLVDTSGELWGRQFRARARAGLLHEGEMEAELDAQIALLGSLGAKLTHWDSHQGAHVQEPFRTAACRAATRAGIARMRTHDYWLPNFGGRLAHTPRFLARHPLRIATFAARRAMTWTCRQQGFRMADRAALLGVTPGTAPHADETWVRLLRALPDGCTEVWCHPGYADADLRRHAALVDTRAAEVRALSNPGLVGLARDLRVELVGFSAI
jgi:chitin disaccharide deacetylase